MKILEVIGEVLNQMVDKDLAIQNGFVSLVRLHWHTLDYPYLKPPYLLIIFFNAPSQSGIYDISINILFTSLIETEQTQYVNDRRFNIALAKYDIALAKVEVDFTRRVARIKSYKMNELSHE